MNSNINCIYLVTFNILNTFKNPVHEKTICYWDARAFDICEGAG
jgi:hypothetical protein